MALSLLCTIITPAFAAVTPVIEPNNGFLKGNDPEWSSAHSAVTPWQLPGHRQYHRDAVVEHTQWHTEHLAERGTGLYNMEHRQFHQDRNMAHRQYHAGLDAEAQAASSLASSISSSLSSSRSSSLSSSRSASMNNAGHSSSWSSSYSSSSQSSGGSSSSMSRDNVSPVVIAITPTSHAIGVATDSNITAKFSESMYATTVTDGTFLVQTSSVRIAGVVTLNGTTATFNPTNALAPNAVYTVTITTSVRDLAGNMMSHDFIWSFTTGSTATNTNQSAVNLGAAATYGVLAGSTVTNTGPTSVTGNVGVSAGTSVAGYPPGVVSGGAIHAGDNEASQAQLALTSAYNELAGRTVAPVSVAGNIGGMSLAPGLYKSTSGLEISSGDLTLDAKGDANAIFIFQVASTLNVASGRNVVLIGGAKAGNVYWQVGTSATLAANSVFKGSILADQSISLQTGANVVGRLLARIGGVTLQGNTIVVPN